VKYIDPDGNITLSQHYERNKYQNGYAPSTQPRMQMLVSLGLFSRIGNTGTHNLTPDQDTPVGRKASVGKFFGTNVDYRGERGTIFEGMQFIYDSNGDLVLDATNKGTFDYNSPFSGIPYFSHNDTDVQPWIDIGNGPDDDVFENVVMSEEIWSKIESFYYLLMQDGKITNKEKNNAKVYIQSLFAPPPVKPNVTSDWEL
jgi:hypothetical protein